jgi:hypothetical protein
MTFWDYLDKNPATWFAIAIFAFYGYVFAAAAVDAIWNKSE